MATKESFKKKQFKEKEIVDEEYEYVTIPPDGGFGWVIAFAAMLCNLVCDGTLFAFGAMKPHLQKEFKCSDMLILMVGSVPCGVYLLVGPIVSGLANRYGCRIIIIIGSIGASACMMLSTLSPNVWVMMTIYGIFGGVFFGMVYLPSVVMVSFYFDKKRAVANGLVTAGTGIGALSYAPFTDFLMVKFGWKVGMIVLACIMLTCILFGAIMKPLQPKKVPIKRIELESPTQVMKKSDQKSPSPPPPSYGEAAGDTNVPLLSGKDDAINADGSGGSNVVVPLKHHRIRTLSSSSQTSSGSGSGTHRLGVPNRETASRPLYKKDALFTGSRQQLHHISQTSLHKNPYMASATNIPALVNETKEQQQSGVRAFADILSAMTDFSILKNKQMLLICIGNIFSMLGYYLPIMCLIAFAVEDNNVDPKKAPFLITVFGFFNTLGRFASGPITMIPHFTALRVHNALLYTAGVLTVLAAYAYDFTSCALYAALCGFAIAPHMALLPSVICDCVGLDRYTTAFGILFLFRGVTSIIGPPAAGFLKDYTKKYELAFAIGGAMIIIATFFHIAVAFVKPEHKEVEEEEQQLKA